MPKEREMNDDWDQNFDDYDGGYWQDHFGGPDDEEIERYRERQAEELAERVEAEQIAAYEAMEKALESQIAGYTKMMEEYAQEQYGQLCETSSRGSEFLETFAQQPEPKNAPKTIIRKRSK